MAQKTSKQGRRYGGISINKPNQIKNLQNQLGPKLERNKKRYHQKRSSLVKLVAEHPEESIATIRQWMLEID
ncbi:hypothetical protein OAJ77_05865 [Rhodospirillales bacterium]|nr:hypothetical protein [Rhodospirillales bacterium]